MVRSVKEFFAVLFGIGLWWWVSILVTYALGIGFFSDYPIARGRLNEVLGWEMLPPDLPFWLVLMPILIWLIIALGCKEVIRRNRLPHIIFENPCVTQVGIGQDLIDQRNRRFVKRIDKGTIYLGKIVIRNKPSHADGKIVERAYCRVEFYALSERNPICKIDYARWTENVKPRQDNFPDNQTPRFKDEMNFRTLFSNGEKNTIDFVVKQLEDAEIWGFAAASQEQPLWKDDAYKMSAGKYLARLRVQGVGMEGSSDVWLVVKSKGADAPLEVGWATYEDAMDCPVWRRSAT